MKGRKLGSAVCASVCLARTLTLTPTKLPQPKNPVSRPPPVRSTYFFGQKYTARRGARTLNLEIKSLTRYRLCQPGLAAVALMKESASQTTIFPEN
jgi:hypothetical protein